MYDLTNFTLREMTHCGAALRKLGNCASSSAEVGQSVAAFLFEQLRAGAAGGPACALVRFFSTRSFADLSADHRARAQSVLGGQPAAPNLKCLVLLGSAGLRPEWNSRQTSVSHQIIPLASVEMVQRSPMISQLVSQFGLEVGALVEPDPALLVDLEQRSYNVFHVADARGSPHVPDQDDFVIRYHIRSVLGFGGMLPSGDLFAVILFATVPIARATADLFRPLALSVKLAMLPFEGAVVWRGEGI
jgi:hypothetical protein